VLLSEDGQELPAFDKELQGRFSRAYEKCLEKKSKVAKYVTFNQSDHIFCAEYPKKDKPFLINMQDKTTLFVKKRE
jgi:hypothetical protein